MAASDTNTASIKVSAQCLCKSYEFTTSMPRTSLPLIASCCHCNSCRHVTGALYTCNVPWPGRFEEIRSSSLSRYQFSQNVTMLFCGECSGPMFFQERFPGRDERFIVFTGALNNSPEPNFVRIADHAYVGDTVDGGASIWLRHPDKDSSIARCWRAESEQSEELDYRWPAITTLPTAKEKTGSDEIPLWCRCKGVNLVFRRGDFASTQRENLPWFVEPTTHKPVAGFDACNSCRSTFGIDIIHWTFTRIQLLDFPGDQCPVKGFPQTAKGLKDAVTGANRDPRFGTLAMYASSPDVQRYFCSQCSASVFYARDDRQELIDVAVGVLESPAGARAEDFLFWEFGSDIGSKEDTSGSWREKLGEAVQKEAEAWRIERGYPKSWRRIANEETEHPQLP